MTELLKSKKFVVAAIGVLAVVLSFVLSKLGLAVPEEKVAEVLGMLGAYVVGQGIADHGKETAKIYAADNAADRAHETKLSDTKGNELLEPGAK